MMAPRDGFFKPEHHDTPSQADDAASTTLITAHHAVTLIERAKNGLAAASKVEEVLEARNHAEWLRRLLRQQRESLASQNAAAELKIRAERKIGELLRKRPKNVGGRPRKKTCNSVLQVPEKPPSLAEQGIDRTTASRFQALASVPEKAFDRFIEQAKADNAELTTAGVLKFARRFARGKRGKAGGKKTAPVAAATTADTGVSDDALGRRIPARLKDVFNHPWPKETATLLKKLLKALAGLDVEALRHRARSITSFLPFLEYRAFAEDVEAAVGHAQQAVARLQAATPYCVCPGCDGAEAGCADCRQSGHLPEARQKELERKRQAGAQGRPADGG
jgi:hypothetical protein